MKTSPTANTMPAGNAAIDLAYPRFARATYADARSAGKGGRAGTPWTLPPCRDVILSPSSCSQSTAKLVDGPPVKGRHTLIEALIKTCQGQGCAVDCGYVRCRSQPIYVLRFVKDCDLERSQRNRSVAIAINRRFPPISL